MRPGELGRLQWRWVSPGVGSDKSRAALLLHPIEGSRASKTGEFDETVIVDDPMLAIVLARLREKRAPGERLIDGEPDQFWALFTEAVGRLKVDKVLGHQVPYVLRHTRASADAWTKRRDLVEIRSRGRWKTTNSVRRYAKGGRVAHQLSLCSAQLVQFCEESKLRLEAVFLEQLLPLCPPPPSVL